MSAGTVNVVIPTYYRNDLLQRAVESVRAQTYDPIDITVVDGSGEAHARPVVGDVADVTYVPQANDRGAHAARSVGAERTDGEYVQFLDDDDVLFEDKIAKQVAVLESDPAVGLVYCGRRWEDGTTARPSPEFRGEALGAALRWQTSCSNTSTMLIRRSVLTEFLPLPNQHAADDEGMKIELARRAAIDYVDEVLVVRGDSDYHLGGTRANVEGYFEILERYDHLYESHPEVDLDRMYARAYRRLGDFLLREHLWSAEAIAAYASALRYEPGTPPERVGELLASLGGRPGRTIGKALYRRLAA
jgi:glycosyltransferase involved in cell wall biosynthesis